MRLKHVSIALTILVASALTMQPRGDWNGLAASGFTYCYVIEPCTGFCEDWVLALGEGCSKTCDVIGELPEVPCGAGGQAEVSSALAWSISGEDESFDFSPFKVSMTASGERIGPSTFLVDGTSSIVGDAELEVAVFRYTGDPSVFDGLDPTSVFDLVESGIIEARDVLLVETTPALGGSFSFEVDVTGLADEEIVLMTTGAGSHESSDVPATRPLSAVGLALIVIALSTAIALKRRPV